MENYISCFILSCFILFVIIYDGYDRGGLIMKYLKIVGFIIFLFLIGHLFTEYTLLLSIILIPYCLLILIEYALFVRKK